MKKINVSFGIDKLFSYSRNDLIITSTLILPHQGGGKFFRELDAPLGFELQRLKFLTGFTCQFKYFLY